MLYLPSKPCATVPHHVRAVLWQHKQAMLEAVKAKKLCIISLPITLNGITNVSANFGLGRRNQYEKINI